MALKLGGFGGSVGGGHCARSDGGELHHGEALRASPGHGPKWRGASSVASGFLVATTSKRVQTAKSRKAPARRAR